MIDISDKQYGTSIRKKFSSKQSKKSDKKRKWVYHVVVDCLGWVDKPSIKLLIEQKND